ncbi:hypothetical protein ACPROK_14690 [Glutamicibacter soli]|uniref:hypothetical protein n=1 Tax=Glutamicibacter soli TaxID=453836 RepID=UPI003C7073B6
MATLYKAKASVVKVAVGSPSGNRVARIVRAGGIIPEGVDEEQLKHLVSRKLIEKVTVTEQPPAQNPVEALKAQLEEAKAATEAAKAEAAAANGKLAEANEQLEAANANNKPATAKTPAAKATGTK